MLHYWFRRTSGNTLSLCALNLLTIIGISACLTTSFSSNSVNAMSSISRKHDSANDSPLCLHGKSLCCGSPVITIFESVPILVRNISIWSIVVFWASSSMMNVSSYVLPLI